MSPRALAAADRCPACLRLAAPGLAFKLESPFRATLKLTLSPAKPKPAPKAGCGDGIGGGFGGAFLPGGGTGAEVALTGPPWAKSMPLLLCLSKWVCFFCGICHY